MLISNDNNDNNNNNSTFSFTTRSLSGKGTPKLYGIIPPLGASPRVLYPEKEHRSCMGSCHLLEPTGLLFPNGTLSAARYGRAFDVWRRGDILLLPNRPDPFTPPTRGWGRRLLLFLGLGEDFEARSLRLLAPAALPSQVASSAASAGVYWTHLPFSYDGVSWRRTYYLMTMSYKMTGCTCLPRIYAGANHAQRSPAPQAGFCPRSDSAAILISSKPWKVPWPWSLGPRSTDSSGLLSLVLAAI